ncbi:unnamed protein product, partial [Rotaria sp. Silwood2]
MNAKKLMTLTFVSTLDVIKGYSSIMNDFDEEDYNPLDHFERVWVGQRKGRGTCQFKHIGLTNLIAYNVNLSSRCSKPKFSMQLWNIN